MHDMAWISHGSRTLPELQTEAGLRGIPVAGVRKEDLRVLIVGHEITRLGTTPPTPAPITPVPPVPAPVVPPPPATPLSIVTAALAGATDGVSYTQVLDANGGIAPYTWTAIVGLPASLTLNTNGILSGTPATADVGNHGIVIRVTDASGASADGNFQLSVAAVAPAPAPAPVPPTPTPAPVPLEIEQVTTGLANAVRGGNYEVDLTPIGGTGTGYRWRIVAPVLPWLRIDRNTGRLTADVPDAAPATLDIEVELTDSGGNTLTETLPLQIIDAARQPWYGRLGDFAPVAGLALVGIAVALLLFFFLPSGVAWAWNHSYWSDDHSSGNPQVKDHGSGGGQIDTNGGQKLSGEGDNTHFSRLENLDPVYRSQGYLAWLNAAGVKCQAVVQARQPEEETSPSGKISVAGLQVNATNCHVPWPVIVTTDVPSRVVGKDSNEVEHQPDPNNGSVLYTNVTVTGPVTIWADGTNWGQFTSKLGAGNPATPDLNKPPSSIKSVDDLNNLGTIIQVLNADGMVAGAQVRLNQDFTAPDGFVIQKQGAEVKTAKAGDTVSIWLPQNLRVKA